MPTQDDMNTCRVCEVIKPSSEFYSGRSVCKLCACEKNKERRKKNLEKVRASEKAYYEANRESRLGYMRAWKRKNQGRTYAQQRNSPSQRALHLLRAAKERAKERGIPCSLTRDWICERIKRGFCEETGIAFDLSVPEKKGQKNPFSPSLDQINAGQGYSSENCRVIVFALNTALGDWGDEKLLQVVEAWLFMRSKARRAA